MTTTIGVFTSHAQAETALRELRAFGVPDADLSYVYTTDNGALKDGQSGEKAAGGAAAGVTAGAVIGGIAGFVVANGLIPGLGTLLVAGPLATALGFTGATAVAGAATGAVAGGLIGALTHVGIKKEDVQLYEDHVRRGDVLVIARSTPGSTQDIFLNNGAVDVRQYNLG